jgi:hypothetical protein|tara:strand:- start:3162 stop:3353 length:192 start_codon:yes stop_codon:yes gene_type:complete
MIEFKVVNTPRHDRFESTVSALLNDGWELHGTPFVSQTGGMTQALVKEVRTARAKKSNDTVSE